MATSTKPQAAIETSGKVRIPAERASRSRSHPIGIASAKATERFTRWEATSHAFASNAVMAGSGNGCRDGQGRDPDGRPGRAGGSYPDSSGKPAR
jgi:hypothetical protein